MATVSRAICKMSIVPYLSDMYRDSHPLWLVRPREIFNRIRWLQLHPVSTWSCDKTPIAHLSRLLFTSLATYIYFLKSHSRAAILRRRKATMEEATPDAAEPQELTLSKNNVWDKAALYAERIPVIKRLPLPVTGIIVALGTWMWLFGLSLVLFWWVVSKYILVRFTDEVP